MRRRRGRLAPPDRFGRPGRTGSHPEPAEQAARLRAWYRENGLTEVDVQAQAAPVPRGVGVMPGRPALATIFQALFGP